MDCDDKQTGRFEQAQGEFGLLKRGELAGQFTQRSIEHNLSYRTLSRGRFFGVSARRPIMYLMFN
jgi:hypothetical protein